MDLESLASVTLVSKLLRQGLDDVRKSVLKGLVHLSEVSLLIQRILHLLHPFGELVTQMGQLHLQIVHAVHERVKCFLTDSTTSTFGDLKVCEGVLQAQQPLLESRHARLQVSEVLALEGFELGAETVSLILDLPDNLVKLRIESPLNFVGLFVSVAAHLMSKSIKVARHFRLVVVEVKAHRANLSFYEVDLLKD